jgi:hypothetical protein
MLTRFLVLQPMPQAQRYYSPNITAPSYPSLSSGASAEFVRGGLTRRSFSGYASAYVSLIGSRALGAHPFLH